MKQSRVETRTYLDMAQERPGDVVREKLCFQHLLEAIPTDGFQSVLETFGGSGLFRSLLPVEPGKHETWDYSEQCCDHLRTRFPGSRVVQADSFVRSIPSGLSLVSADFNTWTPLKCTKDARYAGMTRRLMEAAPKYLQLTDAAVNRLHLNHRSYARAFGVSEWSSGEENLVQWYARNVSLFFYQLGGYSVQRCAYHHGAMYYLLVAGPVSMDFEIRRFKA